MHTAYIGIGSNLEQPLLQIERAKQALQRLTLDNELLCSSIYQSEPLGDKKQNDYFNAVVCITTTLDALILLDKLQEIEDDQGRERNAEHWSSRTLDLDLLLYDEKIINNPRLTVPHYGLEERNFVLYPLAEIAEDLILPNGLKVYDLYQSCSASGIRKIE